MRQGRHGKTRKGRSGRNRNTRYLGPPKALINAEICRAYKFQGHIETQNQPNYGTRTSTLKVSWDARREVIEQTVQEIGLEELKSIGEKFFHSKILAAAHFTTPRQLIGLKCFTVPTKK